jgi:nifR3 family TIM-barrel protein
VDPIYRSPLNRDVPPAAPGEFGPVPIGPISVWPPVVLAPMAGVTNPPFRTLCRRFGAGLYVSEMITARALVEGNRKTLLLASFGAEEKTRSLQLYGVDPRYVGEAVRLLVDEGRVDHIDMNFGCPVRKVTSKGGGAAIPLKPRLLRGIVRAAVRAAGGVPVTLKFRTGIDERHQTYLDAGRIGEEEGCAAVGLHARTAAQLYDGEACWEAIARLKAAVTRIPVLGNGDVWEAEDALRMMRTTGCDGVIVGRGCLGRPWLFRDLADVFDGREPTNPPDFGGVADVMLEHARLLVAWAGEAAAMRAFRKHSSWYTKGFRGGAPLRERLMHVGALAELEAILSGVDRSHPFPPDAMRVPRGKSAGTQRVALPEGYLDDLEDATPPPVEAEVADSGG